MSTDELRCAGSLSSASRRVWDVFSRSKIVEGEMGCPEDSKVVKPSASGSGIGRMKNQPTIIGRDVPIASIRRKSEVFPGNKPCAIVENKNAESPKPDNTNPVVVVRCNRIKA